MVSFEQQKYLEAELESIFNTVSNSGIYIMQKNDFTFTYYEYSILICKVK